MGLCRRSSEPIHFKVHIRNAQGEHLMTTIDGEIVEGGEPDMKLTCRNGLDEGSATITCVDSAIAPPATMTMTPAPRAVMGSTPSHSFHLARFLLPQGSCDPSGAVPSDDRLDAELTKSANGPVIRPEVMGRHDAGKSCRKRPPRSFIAVDPPRTAGSQVLCKRDRSRLALRDAGASSGRRVRQPAVQSEPSKQNFLRWALGQGIGKIDKRFFGGVVMFTSVLVDPRGETGRAELERHQSVHAAFTWGS